MESQVEILDKYPRVSFVHCAVERIDEQGSTIRLEKSIHPSYIRDGREELKRYIFGPRCVGDACLIRRSAYDAVDGPGEMFFWDWELSVRLLQYGDVAYNQRVLMKYRDWDSGYRGGERRWEMFLIRIAFYEKYEKEILRQHPGWLNIFKKARRKAAFSAITTFADYELKTREEIKFQIHRLSSSRLVKVKMFMVEIGLGFLWNVKKQVLGRLRNKIKPVIYRLHLNRST